MNQDDMEDGHRSAPPTIENKLNAMQTFVDQKEFVVIDNGTGFLKCGFSGEDLPRVCIPTVMGVKEIILEASQTNDQGGKKYSRIYGEEAQLKIHDYETHNPIRRGVIEDFDTMKYMWHHLLSHKNMNNQKKCDLLITDSPLNHKDNKLKMAEYLFDKLKDHNITIDSLNIMNSSVLSLFASGRTSGVVVESGQGITTAVPIFEGYALPHAIKSINLSGEDVTDNLLDSLVSQGVELDHSHISHVRKIKEQMCSVALDYERSINAGDPLDEETTLYELPDDKGIIKVDHKTRFNATELLFNPEIVGINSPGIPQISFDSIQK